MRTLLPLISGAFASMDLTMDSNTQNSMSISWTCDADPAETDFTVTYQMLRPDYSASSHPDFAQQEQAVSGATSAVLNGLHGPFEYNVEVCSDAVNTTCGCDSGRFRTAGTAVYVNSIEHYFNGTEGGKSLQGAFFLDDSFGCAAGATLSFGTCDVTVNVYEAASDPAVRQSAGASSNEVTVAIGSAYRRNFVTFSATFDSTTDACWNGALDLGNNPAMDNIAVNETIEANTDYRGAPANSQVDISASALTLNDVAVQQISGLVLDIMVFTDIFDEFGNNVTDLAGDDTGIAMQNQTNFAIAGNLANATSTLDYENIACDWFLTITIDNAACPNVESIEGNMEFTDNGDGTFDAVGSPGLENFFFSAKIPAPDAINGCTQAVLDAATAQATIRAWN